MIKKLAPFLFIVFTILLLSACFKAYRSKIRIDGSSTVYPVTEAVAEEYRAEHGDVKLTVGVSGTGGGLRKLARHEIEIANASRPISRGEIGLCRKNGVEFIELPVCYDGIVIVVNPENDFVDYLSVSELKKIWEPAAQGRIRTWKQVRDTWPDKPLHLYGAGTSSGTYDYFTEAINGTAHSSRGDYTASEDDNVLVQGVSGDRHALGYFGLAYYLENKNILRLIPVKNDRVAGPQEAVYPNDSTIMQGLYSPLARPEFMYVNLEAAKREEVKEFIRFYMQHAGKLVRELGYIPFPEQGYRLIQQRFDAQHRGSLFEHRSHVGMNMMDFLKEAE